MGYISRAINGGNERDTLKGDIAEGILRECAVSWEEYCIVRRNHDVIVVRRQGGSYQVSTRYSTMCTWLLRAAICMGEHYRMGERGGGGGDLLIR